MKKPEATVAAVKAAAGRTWLDASDEGDQILLDTRENGDVGAEEAGYADVKEAMRVLKELRKTFKPADYLTSMEVVDEWVHVSVRKLPYTPEERKEQKMQKRLRKLEEEVKAMVELENENLRKGVKNLRNSFAPYLSRNGHGCYSRLLSLRVSVFYGKRFLYQDHGGACFTYCDAEAARKGLHALLEKLDLVIKHRTDWTFEVKGPWDKTTYNYAPPNNIIEKHGEVIAQCQILDGTGGYTPRADTDTCGNPRMNYVYPVTISSADYEPRKPKPDPKKRVPFYREFLKQRKKR